jgi:hypothetical protein
MSTTKTIYGRLIDFQSQMPVIEKGAKNPFFKSKYATLDSIQFAIQPILKEVGLAYTQTISEDKTSLITTLYDEEGKSLVAGNYPVNLSGKAQDVGSAITYAKRYSLVAFLGLIVADESDDDGNQAQDTKKVEIKKPTFTQTNFEHAIKLIGEGKEKEAYAYAGQFEIAEEFKAELKNALETYKATLKTN